MNKKMIFVFLICGTIATSVAAQHNTGDVQLNESLSKIDADAKLDFGKFKAEVSAKYNIATNKIEEWSAKVGMKPSDICMTAEVAKITQKPADEVVEAYQKNKDKGWGVIAKELGIKPGSPEFHALKNSMGGKGNGQGKGHKDNGKGRGKGKGKK